MSSPTKRPKPESPPAAAGDPALGQLQSIIDEDTRRVFNWAKTVDDNLTVDKESGVCSINLQGHGELLKEMTAYLVESRLVHEQPVPPRGWPCRNGFLLRLPYSILSTRRTFWGTLELFELFARRAFKVTVVFVEPETWKGVEESAVDLSLAVLTMWTWEARKDYPAEWARRRCPFLKSVTFRVDLVEARERLCTTHDLVVITE